MKIKCLALGLLVALGAPGTGLMAIDDPFQTSATAVFTGPSSSVTVNGVTAVSVDTVSAPPGSPGVTVQGGSLTQAIWDGTGDLLTLLGKECALSFTLGDDVSYSPLPFNPYLTQVEISGVNGYSLSMTAELASPDWYNYNIGTAR